MRMDDYLASVGNSFLQHVVKRPELSIKVEDSAKQKMTYFVLVQKVPDKSIKRLGVNPTKDKVVGKYISMDDLIVSNFPDEEGAWVGYFSEKF